jgi:hypothetical protein
MNIIGIKKHFYVGKRKKCFPIPKIINIYSVRKIYDYFVCVVGEHLFPHSGTNPLWVEFEG